jgi:hypothetical protein
VTGQNWKVRVEGAAFGTEVQEAALPLAPLAEDSLTRVRRLREEAENEPLVRKAIEVLGAQVLRVDEGFNETVVRANSLTASSEEKEESEEG